METLTIFSWYNTLPIHLQVYWGIAIFASTIFIIQTVMSFIGTGDVDTGDGADVDFGGGDTDMGGVDTDTEAPDSMDHAGGMHLLSIRNVVYFLLGFGWTGVSFWKTIDNPTLLCVLAVLVGCAFVAIFLIIFRQMLKLQHNGAFDINDAVGKVCDVYLRIPAAGTAEGKVQISFNGSVQELPARTNADRMIPSGAKVKVLEVVDRRILLVEQI